MPSLENRSIHPLGSFQSYPRRCLAASHRSLPCRYCCSHTLNTSGEALIDLPVVVFTRSVLSSLIPVRKTISDPPSSLLFLFFQKAPLMVRQHIPVPFPACTGDSASSDASRKHLHQCRQYKEQTGGARKTMYSYREMTSLGSWRHGGMVHTTEALQWMDTGSSGRAGWESRGLALYLREQLDAWSSAWGWFRSQSRTYGS